jgi:hypothetical protein
MRKEFRGLHRGRLHLPKTAETSSSARLTPGDQRHGRRANKPNARLKSGNPHAEGCDVAAPAFDNALPARSWR